MSTLMDELTAIKAVEDKLTANKVANFAYTDHAYNNPLTEADGVETYDVGNEQNIPVANASILKVNTTVLTKGWRAQASAITRMLMNHFLGRCSYNLNKINDLFSLLLTKLMAYMGVANGLATLDENGYVPTAQLSLSKGDVGLGNVVNTGDSNTPTENGTDKFTTGGMYTFEDSLCPIFSQERTYVKEDLVIYNNQTYRCSVASHTGAWDAQHFTRVQPFSQTRPLFDMVSMSKVGTPYYIPAKGSQIIILDNDSADTAWTINRSSAFNDWKGILIFYYYNTSANKTTVMAKIPSSGNISIPPQANAIVFVQQGNRSGSEPEASYMPDRIFTYQGGTE